MGCMAMLLLICVKMGQITATKMIQLSMIFYEKEILYKIVGKLITTILVGSQRETFSPNHPLLPE